MRKILSLVLVFAMAVSLFANVQFAFGADTLTYSFKIESGTKIESVKGVADFDTYESTGRNWKFCSMNDSLREKYNGNYAFARTMTYGLQIQSEGNEWLSLAVKIPTAGTYSVEYKYSTVSWGKTGDIFLSPMEAGIEKSRNGEYKLGSVSYAGGGEINSSDLGTITVGSDNSEYILTFVSTGNTQLPSEIVLKPVSDDPITEKYDFKKYKSSYYVPEIKYEDTDNTWEYHSCESSLWDSYNTSKNFIRNPAGLGYGIQVQSGYVGQYLALKLKVRKAGNYNVKFTYAKASLGGEADVFIAPIAETDITNEKYKVGSVSFYNETQQNLNEKKLKSLNITSAGEYVVTFLVTGKNKSCNMYLTGLEFNPNEAALESVTLTAEKTRIKIGEETKTMLSGKLSDGAEDDLSAADVVYESSNEEIAKVDADGKITAMGAGTAKITARVTLLGITKESSCLIRVETDENPPYTGVSVLYDLKLGAGKYEDSDMRPIKYADTDGVWEFGGYDESMIPADAPKPGIYIRNNLAYGVQVQSNREKNWFAVKVNISDVGRTKFVLDYSVYKYGGIGNIYFVPASYGKEHWRSDAFKLGEVNFYEDVSSPAVKKTEYDLTIESAGEYAVVFEAAKRLGGCNMYMSGFTLDGQNGVKTVPVLPKKSLKIGESMKISYDLRDYNDKKTSLPNISVSYNSITPDILEVSDDGTVSAKALGTGIIEIGVLSEGTLRRARCEVYVGTGKRGVSFYTEEKRKNAVENAKKYDWAKTLRDKAVKEADIYVGNEEKLWNLITQEGIPRGITVGYQDDPNAYKCRYCGEDLRAQYGAYPWKINVLTRPWKIQCPSCKRVFPSNDFGSFYNLGIDEEGKFDYELAHKRNAEIVANGGEGYLVNKLYPEAEEKFGDANWGVDDGFGYIAKNPDGSVKTYANGVEEAHTYIAYYNHWGIWFGKTFTTESKSLVGDALTSLRDAYLYTGDEKYGRVGAILIDRIADVYSDMSLTQYGRARGNERRFYNSHGLSDEGKAIGRIWETDLARLLATSYDAFYPMTEDSGVIRFLSQKAEEYNMPNKKTDANLIRGNCEDGILRSIFSGFKSADINGNFGMHQSALAAAAVALDSQPETKEWIDYVMQDGTKSIGFCSGGNVQRQIYNDVDRDGHGNESAPGYNGLWVTRMIQIAECLAGYDGYPSADLYKNPRVIKMMTAQGDIITTSDTTPQIGDQGETAAVGTGLVRDNLLLEYIRTGENSLAQLLYAINGNTTDGLHADIFTKNPEDVKKDIKKIIDENGEYDFTRTVNYTGYGFAILRDGVLYKDAPSVSGVLSDSQRDFWIYYGGSTISHKHADALNLGIEAFGLNLAPDLGYPEDTGYNVNREQWVNNTISHNTVVVNEKKQNQNAYAHTPLHFDNGGNVKLMDIDAQTAYDETDIYRRTVVMVKLSEDISYGVDFFRIKGGNDHIYSFHSQSDEVSVSGVNLVAQGAGTYAGEDVEWGDESDEYANGFSWLGNVRRDSNPQTGTFTADFKVKDFRNTLRNKKDIHLAITMLNDFELSEVTVAEGTPPRVKGNIKMLEYVLARRKGENLDSLFTTVIEPYSENSLISNKETVGITAVSGSEGSDNTARAVKITCKNGRTDYVVYATNNTVTYRIDNKFDFRGFVGVYTCGEDGTAEQTYLNDGDKIGDIDYESPDVSGTIKDFTREYTSENSIEVSLNREIADEELTDKYIYINNDGVQNGVYRIVGATHSGTDYTLDIGDVTVARGIEDGSIVYNISSGDSFRIPLSYTTDSSPVIKCADKVSVTAESSVSVKVTAESRSDRTIKLSAELPTGASFNPETGELTWKPNASQVGKNYARIIAEINGITSSKDIEITVYGATTPSGGGGGGGDNPSPTPTPTPEPKPEPKPEPTPTPTPDPDPTPSDDGFIDIGDYGWAKDSINSLAKDGIIKGTSKDTFSPSANITRADFAILLVRAFKLEGEGKDNFADVSEADYFAKELAIAKENGIVGGIGDNKYAPRSTITREDMMVIVYRALRKLGYELKDGDVTAPDFDSVSDYAKEAVKALMANGLVNGKNGYIDPKANTTRAEVAVLLKRILDFTARK